MLSLLVTATAASAEGKWVPWFQHLDINRTWTASRREMSTAEECANWAHNYYVATVKIATELGRPGEHSHAQVLCLPKGVHPELEAEWSRTLKPSKEK